MLAILLFARNHEPSSIKQWRESNGGTHAVIAIGFVKKDGTNEDVEKGLYEAVNSVKK